MIRVLRTTHHTHCECKKVGYTGILKDSRHFCNKLSQNLFKTKVLFLFVCLFDFVNRWCFSLYLCPKPLSMITDDQTYDSSSKHIVDQH